MVLSWSSPVLLVAAIPQAAAAESRLAQRPRSGLALTRRTRPRPLSGEEAESITLIAASQRGPPDGL